MGDANSKTQLHWKRTKLAGTEHHSLCHIKAPGMWHGVTHFQGDRCPPPVDWWINCPYTRPQKHMKTVLLLHCILVKFTTKISHHRSLLPREKWRELVDPTWCLGCAHPSSNSDFIEEEALALPCYIFLLTYLDFLWSKICFESGLHLGKINNQLP